MLHRQKIAQTKAEHKENSDGATVQRRFGRLFLSQENEKGCRTAVERKQPPPRGPKHQHWNGHPVQERLQCCMFGLIWRYLFFRCSRNALKRLKSNCVSYYRHFTSVCQVKIATERIVMKKKSMNPAFQVHILRDNRDATPVRCPPEASF